MHKFKLAALGLMAVLIALVMCACGPEEDTTDDLLISVEVPFSTTSVLTTPSTIELTGWSGERVILNDGEYSVLTRDPVSIGDDVRKLQNRLIELGYLSNEKNATSGNYKRANGKFDVATEQAVEKFEAAYGRSPTGVATELMQYYLYSTNARAYTGAPVSVTSTPSPTPTVINNQTGAYRYLQRGDSGDDVTRLQQRLYELGYLNYVSGSYDTATEYAVAQFASAYGQNTNGNATVELQKALFSSSARTYRQMLSSITATPTASPTPAPWDGYVTLQAGDSGTQVTNLQKRLRELGYMHSKADGIYGERTIEAVKKFEAAYGRPETGIATAELQMYLYSDDAIKYGTVTPTPYVTATPTPAFNYTTLSIGSTGDEVVRLQMRLIELGYLGGSADGEYGTMTKNAVMAFEQAYGATPTGVATPTLQRYLFSDSARYNPYVTATPEPTASTRSLSFGDSGEDVMNLQYRLAELGYYGGGISGYFDDATENAVRLFERAYGHSETGVASKALQAYLYSSSAKVYVTPTPAPVYGELRKGDKGDQVKQLQTRLAELGYLSGSVDGYFGEGTEQAIKYFEQAYGRTPTGVATSELQAYLYSSSAKRNTGNVAVSYSSLSSGDSGAAVTNLQNRLIQLGYMNGSASGVYDNRTVNAVKSFQKLMGYSVTGSASSELQQRLFGSSAKNYSSEKVVTVNKTAVVKASSTGVYVSFYDESPSVTISRNTQLTVLRTRGIWAEVQSSTGYVGYVMLSDLEYSSQGTSSPTKAPETTNVNANATINTDGVTVYASPSTTSKKLGTLNKGQAVIWVSTSGEWAEIRNNSGSVVGYVKTSQLSRSGSSSSSSGTSPASGYTSLKYGDTGTGVKNIQTRLTQLGYFYGDIGGNYLTKTQTAVKAFQKAIGLNPDGVSTPGLQDIMFCAYAPSINTYSPKTRDYTDMYQGRSDSQVKAFQNQLMALGYLSSASGTYDSATVKAVSNAQKALGLKDTSGIASRELQAFLFTAGDLIKR